MSSNEYSVTLNSDRAHVVKNHTPVETFMFRDYPEPSDAIGLAVAKAMKISQRSVLVRSLGYFTEKSAV
jgi:hypothetical protein